MNSSPTVDHLADNIKKEINQNIIKIFKKRIKGKVEKFSYQI